MPRNGQTASNKKDVESYNLGPMNEAKWQDTPLLNDPEVGNLPDFPVSGRGGEAISEKDDEENQDDQDRHTWGRKAEYVLSMIGYSVGLGNVWRFPYVCIRNGGGAFLIPFFICLTLCGMPLYFLEVCLGQFVSKSSLHVWSICPLFKGIGISMNVVSFICSWYYSLILAWTLIFFVNSFRSPLPWTVCGQWWNTEHCVTRQGGKTDSGNTTDLTNSTINPNLNFSGYDLLDDNSILINNSILAANVTAVKSTSASEEFWLHNVLQLSPGIEHIDGIPLQSGIALTAGTLIVFLCIIKGVNSVGKVVYVTATLPYILLSVLIIKGFTLEGALDGVLFYVKPDFSKLLTVQTWVEASIQVFYSLGPGFGGLITMASYNKFKNNCMKDAVMLAFICEGSSVFAAFAIFTVLGHMAHTLNVPVSNFSDTGPGLAFVVYPEAISYLPLPQLWGVLFFLMLFTLGLDTQFVMCETLLTTTQDLLPRLKGNREVLIKIGYMLALMLITLPFAARNGMYLFQLADWYIAAYAVFCNGIVELIIVTWIYGADRFLYDIRLMIGRRPPCIFVLLWKFITPLILVVCMVTTLLTYTAPDYKGYIFPPFAIGIGWFIASISFVPLPLYMVYKLATTEGDTFMERLRMAVTPEPSWQPAHGAGKEIREQYRLTSKDFKICDVSFRFPCCRK